MPAIRTTNSTKSQSTTPPSFSTKSAPGWSKERKSALFNHVLKSGERDWKVAVPGKTGKEENFVAIYQEGFRVVTRGDLSA